MDGGGPTISRRRLGRVLRELRERQDLTGETAARAVERSGSWISRVESGRIGLRSRDLRDLLDLYQVSDPATRDELEALARQGRQRGWWSRYSEGLPEPLVVFLGLEDAASAISIYQDSVVPGLLQTERYCRALIQHGAAMYHLSPDEITLRVQVRMTRQSHLERRPRPLRFLLDERLLYRTIGGKETLREQLDRLLEASRRPHIDVRVIPFGHGDRVAIASSFGIARFPDDPEIVWLDTPAGLIYEESAERIKDYHRAFELLTAAALSPAETIQLIREARGKLA